MNLCTYFYLLYFIFIINILYRVLCNEHTSGVLVTLWHSNTSICRISLVVLSIPQHCYAPRHVRQRGVSHQDVQKVLYEDHPAHQTLLTLPYSVL